MSRTYDGRDLIESIEASIAASRTEEEEQFFRSHLKRSWPGAMTGGDELEWGKRDLIHLYEDYNFEGSPEGMRMSDFDLAPEFSRFKHLPPHNTTLMQSTFEHSTFNNQVMCDENEVKTTETLFWRTGIRNVTTTEDREFVRKQELVEHFANCDWYFPLLLGSQHNNRFKRNTKVYVLSGVYKGRHGTVVGHDSCFDVKAWGSPTGKSPLLKVLLVCPIVKYLEVKSIYQDVVKLVDLHDQLDFAVPAMYAPGSSEDKGRLEA